MIKNLMITALIALSFTPAFAQSSQTATPAPTATLILLISEQNIDSPRQAWWASEVDLSVAEAAIATRLLDAGFQIVEPGAMPKVINQDKAFRMVNLSDKTSIKMASLAKADYVILGKAIASAGGNVPQSSMRSYFANITAKLINVKTGRVVAYLDAAGNSAHMDVISGGREALAGAGQNIAGKIVDKLNSILSASRQ